MVATVAYTVVAAYMVATAAYTAVVAYTVAAAAYMVVVAVGPCVSTTTQLPPKISLR